MKKINLFTTGLATTFTETFKIRNIDYLNIITDKIVFNQRKTR